MKSNKLSRGDKVAIVSLSSGVLGEQFVKHEIDLGIKRLEELELDYIFMPNSMLGINKLAENPKLRAADLKAAFLDDSIKAIICAIGGTDGYKIIPYLLDDEEFVETVKNNPKIFLGFSDSTVHHLLLNSIGLNTFYGPAFLTDFAELEGEMLGYTKYNVYNLFLNNPKTQIESSKVWYKERTDFSANAVGTKREVFLEENGYIKLQGSGKVKGNLYGGCLDVIYDILSSEDAQKRKIFDKYKTIDTNCKNKVLFLETSDNKVEPKVFRNMISLLKQKKFFDEIKALLFAKPQDQAFMNEYMQILKEELPNTAILCNLNFGHSYPRCIIPYNLECELDFDNLTVTINENMFAD